MTSLAPPRARQASVAAPLLSLLAQPSDDAVDGLTFIQQRICAEPAPGQYLMTGATGLTARRAASCLLVPRPGDTVLLATVPSGTTAHIIAILERSDREGGTLALPGDTRIDSAKGTLALHADALALQGRKSLQIDTARFALASLSAHTTVKHWQGVFDTLEAQATSLQLVAKTLSSKVGRLISRSLEALRLVDGLDETRAGRHRTAVRETYRVQADHITARARGFVDIDGEKINLG